MAFAVLPANSVWRSWNLAIHACCVDAVELATSPWKRKTYGYPGEPLPIRIIADDLLPRIAARNHVINGALKLDPKSSWHAGRLGGLQTVVKSQNNKQSLTPRSHLLED